MQDYYQLRTQINGVHDEGKIKEEDERAGHIDQAKEMETGLLTVCLSDTH